MKQYTIEEAQELSDRITTITSFIIAAAVTFAIGVILVRLMWSWTMPSIFPGAVEQGLIAEAITWLDALKITALGGILATTGSLVAGGWTR